MRKNFVPDRSGDMVRCAELVLEARSSFSRCSLSTYSIEVGPRVYRGSNTRHLPLREIGERWSTENKLMICFQMEYRWSTENNMMISESNIESMEHRCTKCLIWFGKSSKNSQRKQNLSWGIQTQVKKGGLSRQRARNFARAENQRLDILLISVLPH